MLLYNYWHNTRTDTFQHLVFTTLGVEGVQENRTEYRKTGQSTEEQDRVKENRTEYRRTGRIHGEKDRV